jgi:restriction system protein
VFEYKPYQHLKSFKQTTIIYDFTVEFIKLYIESYRTRSQMEQAARSGKQNIAEGSEIGRTSRKSELKLLGVARGSLKELKEDYQDYLRQNNLQLWHKNCDEAISARKIVYQNVSYSSYSSYLKSASSAANVMICLINQTTYLIDRQVEKLEADFIKNGGYNEQLYRKRVKYRDETKLAPAK